MLNRSETVQYILNIKPSVTDKFLLEESDIVLLYVSNLLRTFQGNKRVQFDLSDQERCLKVYIDSMDKPNYCVQYDAMEVWGDSPNSLTPITQAIQKSLGSDAVPTNIYKGTSRREQLKKLNIQFAPGVSPTAILSWINDEAIARLVKTLEKNPDLQVIVESPMRIRLSYQGLVQSVTLRTLFSPKLNDTIAYLNKMRELRNALSKRILTMSDSQLRTTINFLDQLGIDI